MGSSNARKAEILGMPFGTATNRLRRAIIFRLLKKLGEDKCFQCGTAIEQLVDLSIEHKMPWAGDAAMFWDLENIAFSHLKCNIGAANRERPRRKGKFAPVVQLADTYASEA